MTSVATLRPEDEADVTKFLAGEPAALAYASRPFVRLLRTLLGCEEQTLVARDADGGVAGVLPLLSTEAPDGRRVHNSLPYYGSNGGVLAADGTARDALVEEYDRIALDTATLASTIVPNPFDAAAPPRYAHTHSDERIAQYTPLAPDRDPLDDADSSARRNVAKAEREGIAVATEADALPRLHEIHRANIAALGGLPKDRRFFDLVPQHLEPGREYDVYVARKDGAVVAGLLVLYFNTTVEYYTPAVEHEARPLQPLAAILARALRDAAARGFTVWNWGATWKTQEGVYRFKRKWGAEEMEYRYFTQVNDESLLRLGRDEILQRFPGFFIVPFGALEAPG